jgi:outer membrane PBP1 activator LpoA protein
MGRSLPGGDGDREGSDPALYCRTTVHHRPQEVQVVRLAAVLVATAVLCGCGRDAGPPAPATTTSGADQLLQGSLLQFRRDAEARRVQVRLTAARDGVVVRSRTSS